MGLATVGNKLLNMGDLSFNPHPITLAFCLVAIFGYRYVCSINPNPDSQVSSEGTTSPFSSKRMRCTSRQKWFFAFGLGAVFLANYWPLAEVARHDLLLGRMTQQLLITLAAPPLLLMSLPKVAVVHLTRPRFLDFALTTLTRPLPSIIIFSIATVSAISPPLVRFEAAGSANDLIVQVMLFIASVLVWIPVLRILPGIRHLSTAGRLAYVFVLSLVPSIPAIVLIFARRSLYSTYSHGAFGISAVGDQELTGALAKIASLAVFWGIAIVILLRADRDEELGIDPEPLTWDDVQRELDRSSKKNPPG